ncbi:MAG TPA: hypothetical protein VHV47_07650 [Opitutaceae bacterium]|jgi:hypothetical protein|nr:hypothetical protein [Opitutaceae bacterium]
MPDRFSRAATVTALFWLAIFYWLGAFREPWIRGYRLVGPSTDYYHWLVDGFLSGHTYLKTDVAPDLLSPDPEIRAHAPRLLDAALYRGHYYLYYGVTPAICVLLPYRLITGQALGIETAIFAFWAAGFAVSLAWLGRWRRDFLPGAGPGLAALLVSLLAVLPAMTFAVRRGEFYELPIAAGYACIAWIFLALYEVGRGRAVTRWLAVASAAAGAAVGCRPNHLLFVFLVGGAAWAATRGRPSAEVRRRWLAAALPALAVGSLLAWYNWARFGSPLDFGFYHGVNQFFGDHLALLSPRFLAYNLSSYFLRPASLSCYFPFVFPSNTLIWPKGYGAVEAIHGFFPATLLAGWCLAGWFGSGAFRRSDSSLRGWMAGGFAAAAGQVAFLGLIAVRADRYMVDFLAPASFGLTAAAGLAWASFRRSAPRVLWRAGCGLLALAAGLHAVLGAAQIFDLFSGQRPGEFLRWSDRLDPSSRTLQRLGLPGPATLQVTVRFHQPSSRFEPLLVTGLPLYNDGVYIASYPGGFAEVMVDHRGYGGPHSGLFPIAWDHDYAVTVELGSLLPPSPDRFFAGAPDYEVAKRKHTARIKFDGRIVLQQQLSFFEAPPWARYLGFNPMREGAAPARFSGQIVSARWVPAPARGAPDADADDSSGLIRLDLSPEAPPGSGLPILCAGITGAGNLLVLQVLPGARYRLALDEWGRPLQFGPPFALAPGRPHRLELFIGPLAAGRAWPGGRSAPAGAAQVLVAWIDGRLAANFPLLINLDSFHVIAVGHNATGFSTAQYEFMGTLTEQPLGPSAERELMVRAAAVLSP